MTDPITPENRAVLERVMGKPGIALRYSAESVSRLMQAVREDDREAAPPIPAEVEALIKRLEETESARAEVLREMYVWTGSKFLSGERMSIAENLDHKGRLYSFLCGLLGWFSPDQEAIEAAQTLRALAVQVGELERENGVLRDGDACWAKLMNAAEAERDTLKAEVERLTEELRVYRAGGPANAAFGEWIRNRAALNTKGGA